VSLLGRAIDRSTAQPRRRMLVSNFDALVTPFAVTEAPRA
jgi:hypothetical protein